MKRTIKHIWCLFSFISFARAYFITVDETKFHLVKVNNNLKKK